MTLPSDYIERVYAGVLGKIIGVYLGRPFEGWTYDRIMAELGEIWYYVHEKRHVPLIVTDDDISGTFTFLRALDDYASGRKITPAQIGQTWMNYLIEEQSVLWWGGLGNSTEHTAYLRMKHGIPAPASGSIAVNGKTVAEQIGAQIFIDGWAMVAPGDPELAAELARKAGSVSHDGEALYGAQVLAAMEALAFVESDVERLISTAVTFIPRDSVIYRMVQDIREWHAKYPDWRMARQQIEAHYGYDKYGGNCHMVPNHALIHLGLLYGAGDFQKSLMICNTSGWDTDCNSGNLGCLMGIRNGLAGIDLGPDWRGPLSDRLYLPTADGGRAVTDAVQQTYFIANLGRKLAGLKPLAPKGGARFHFELPGAVQGFLPDESPEGRGNLALENVAGHSQRGKRSLALHYRHLAPGRHAQAATATFIPPDTLKMPHYGLQASPTLYPGQVVSTRLEADSANPGPVTARLFLNFYDAQDQPCRQDGPQGMLYPGQAHELTWRIGDLGGCPIFEVGIELTGSQTTPSAPDKGTVYLDYLAWDGEPEVTFTAPAGGRGQLWKRTWTCSASAFESRGEPFRIIQNEGRGMIIQGTRQWTNYRLEADLVPHMLTACGIAARVQGLQRYYALLLAPQGKVRLVRALDGETVLAEADLAWRYEQTYPLALEVQGDWIRAWLGDAQLFEVQDGSLPSGGVALVCEEGRMATDAVRVRPLPTP